MDAIVFFDKNLSDMKTKLTIKGSPMQIWKSFYKFVFILKQYPEKQYPHISRVHISKSKSWFNVNSSTYYLHMETKILADFQIYISVPLRREQKFHKNICRSTIPKLKRLVIFLQSFLRPSWKSGISKCVLLPFSAKKTV